MDVAELFNPFAFSPDIKVIKSRLPELAGHGPQLGLARVVSQKPPREAQLQRLHQGREVCPLRLAQQQVDVLRHDHISDYDQPVAAANALQRLQE